MYIPTQFLSVASNVNPAEHSQAKLPRVLRQIPLLHKPGNLVHSSISAKKIQLMLYSFISFLVHFHHSEDERVLQLATLFRFQIVLIVKTLADTSPGENISSSQGEPTNTKHFVQL